MVKQTKSAEKDKKTTKKIGRPETWSQDLADTFCSYIAEGMSMRTACKQEGMPVPVTIFKWRREREEFMNQYAQACKERSEAFAEEIQEIADNASNDWMEDNYDKGKTPGYTLMGEHIQRSKLRIDTRKWLMSKMQPKKYGDQLDITSGGEKLPTPIIPGAQLKRDADK